MKLYRVKIHYESIERANNKDEAINKVFEDLEDQSNMSLTNTLCWHHTKVKIIPKKNHDTTRKP